MTPLHATHLFQHTESWPHLLEPQDLEDLDPRSALYAVRREIETHPARPGHPDSVFNATSHIHLLAILISRISVDALFYMEYPEHAPEPPEPSTEALTAIAIPLSAALNHHARALGDLHALQAPAAPGPSPRTATLAHLDAAEQSDRVQDHFHHASAALEQAHATLARTQPPAAPRAAGTGRPPRAIQENVRRTRHAR